MQPLQVDQENAELIWQWFQQRGGLAIWDCQDPSNPGQTWTTPIVGPDDESPGKPHWSAGKIIRTITDPGEVVAVVPREVKRFHIGVNRRGTQFVVSEGGSRRIKSAVAQASKEFVTDAWHAFDFGDYENVVICVPDEVTTLEKFVKEQKNNG